MNINLFLSYWLLIAFTAILVRPKMIWQEERRNYRIALAFLTLPFTVLCGIYMTVRWSIDITRATIDGVDSEAQK